MLFDIFFQVLAIRSKNGASKLSARKLFARVNKFKLADIASPNEFLVDHYEVEKRLSHDTFVADLC